MALRRHHSASLTSFPISGLLATDPSTRGAKPPAHTLPLFGSTDPTMAPWAGHLPSAGPLCLGQKLELAILALPTSQNYNEVQMK